MLLGASGLFTLLALLSYHPSDVPFLTSETNRTFNNLGGTVGVWLSFLGRGGFGWASLSLAGLFALWARRLWKGELAKNRWAVRALATVCLLTGLGTLASLVFGGADPAQQTQAGGMIGYLLVRAGRYYLGAIGTGLLASCVTLLAWILVSDSSALPKLSLAWLKNFSWRTPALSTPSGSVAIGPVSGTPPMDSSGGGEPDTGNFGKQKARIRSTVVVQKPKVLSQAQAATARPRQASGGFQLPPLDLLDNPPPIAQRQQTDDLQAKARILEQTLLEFSIEARCVNIDKGPTVTRFELSPAPGVKLTKIVALADDLALVLKTSSCHIIAPIPGKGLVGIDVPNMYSTTVYLKELLMSREFQQARSPLTLAIGKDVSGVPVITDLRDAPHILVAGATGSGKTVCLNSLLTGILFHASPDDVKFLMIDPKMVELVLFNDIPHLVAPVVTDTKKAAAALFWATKEMERRYQLLSKAAARNIAGYNEKVRQLPPNPEQQFMPYLVIVIDELADLMMVSSREVEEAITRLAQLSRAVGIHIIMATQRPSVDVITGVIKANFPARIAFQVASKVDSRTILDANGADKLLGRGDLLFLKGGAPKPMRAQACFLTDTEIERVTAFLKQQRQPVYDESLMASQEKSADDPFGGNGMSGEKDEMYEAAKKLVLETGQASTSLLQRRLRLGYGRAARILDVMEQEGIVGPPQGSRPREVLTGSHANPSS